MLGFDGLELQDDPLHAKAAAERIPLSASFELTRRCNFRCKHCYIPLCERISSPDDVSIEHMQRIVEEISEAGCMYVCLSGGEPLLRHDFTDIYLLFKQAGFVVDVFTNGSLITPEIADLLVEWPPNVVEVTLYGATPETFAEVTGIPHSFRLCCYGIDLLRKRGVNMRLKTTVTRANTHEVDAIRRFASKLGYKDYRIDPALTACLDRSRTPCECRLSPEEIVEWDRADEFRLKSWLHLVEHRKGGRPNGLYTCTAGSSSFQVDAYGRLSLCHGAPPQTRYDLIGGSFSEGWEHLRQIRDRDPEGDFRCLDCEVSHLCGSCPVRSWLEAGDERGCPEFYKQVAVLRRQMIDEELARVAP